MVLLAALMTALASVVPLSDVHYDVAVSGPIADVRITQTFQNDGPTTVEAVYLFPLHERAVVDAMSMRLDDRTIEGRIEEKQVARAQYDAAIQQGQTAALTETVRWNLFQQTVGNIPPGARIEVSLRVIQPVPRVDGRFELVVPLADGARFLAPGQTIDEALAEPVSTEGVKGHVHVLVDGGVEIRDFHVPSHEAFVAPTGEGWEAHASDLPLDSDFVAEWWTRTDAPQVGALHDGEHLLLVLEPPIDQPFAARRKRELVVVMSRAAGADPGMSASALQRVLGTLTAEDTVTLVPADGVGTRIGPVSGDPGTVAQIRAAAGMVRPGDGEQLARAVTEALALPADPSRQRYVLVALDGLVQDEVPVLRAVAEASGAARVYALGTGLVNRLVTDELAHLGGGVGVTVSSRRTQPLEDLVAAMDRPVLSGIEVDWGDWGAMDLAPARVPDVHLGHASQVVARTRYEEGGPIVVRGWVGDAPVELRVHPRRVARGRAIASTWARQRIEALGRRQIREGIPAREEGLPLALEYQVLSPWTSFIAIDPRVRRVVVEPTHPEEGRADTTVANDAKPREDIARDGWSEEASLDESWNDEPAPEPPPRARPASKEYKEDFYAEDAKKGGIPASKSAGSVAVETTSVMLPGRVETDSLSLYEGWARVRALGGSTDTLRRGEGFLGFGVPLIRDRWAVAADGSLDLRAIEDGRWRSLPVHAITRVRGANESDGLEIRGWTHWVDASAPLVDASAATRHTAGGTADARAGGFRLVGQVLADTYTCVRCDPRRRILGRIDATTGWGDRWRGGHVGMHAQRTSFRGIDDRASTDLGLDLRVGVAERAWFRVDGAADAFWVDQELRFVPTGRVEIGGIARDIRISLGAARQLDWTAPELALPRTHALYATLAAGDPTSPVLVLQSGWERRSGPLALPVGRLTALPDLDAAWSRDAVLTEARLHVPGDWRGAVELRAAWTLLVKTDADLATPTAPWTPGLLLAHRPFQAFADTRVRLVDATWSTDLEVEGGLASPLPGDRWWSGWQALGKLGVVERIEIRDGTLAIGVHGTARQGRPGEIDLGRPDGWFVPTRLGALGLMGSVGVEL